MCGFNTESLSKGRSSRDSTESEERLPSVEQVVRFDGTLQKISNGVLNVKIQHVNPYVNQVKAQTLKLNGIVARSHERPSKRSERSEEVSPRKKS